MLSLFLLVTSFPTCPTKTWTQDFFLKTWTQDFFHSLASLHCSRRGPLTDISSIDRFRFVFKIH
ncbi:hypothetical protein KP509_01G099700 [Ceratopteris richardii]|uniref:Secreted protein n=1 Tax=Ceratopteris richardii TaxID=49495 RepID=A0A8T2VFM4_CERRI|nr:hypothetical protein KP509_01G099700 [Ceratopteris richardii]